MENYKFVFCWCDNSSFTLREERRLKKYDNWLLRGRCGSKTDEETGNWRKLNSEELSDLCTSTKFSVEQIMKNDLGG